MSRYGTRHDWSNIRSCMHLLQSTFNCGEDVVRPIHDISEHARSSSYGCRSVPFVSLPFTHGVMDELHMML